MPTKYVMKIYSKRHSISLEITDCQALRGWESDCAVVYCANPTQPNNLTLLNSMVLHPVARVSRKFVQLHRTQPLFIISHSFILILITLHVSAHFSGHLQA
jgi:hypothetical protein